MSLDSIAASSMSLSSIFQSIQSNRGDRFAAADADSSGDLSLEEFSAAREAKGVASADSDVHAERFAALDEDGDGSLTKSEMAAGGHRKMEALSSAIMGMLLQLQEETGQKNGVQPPPPPPSSDQSSSLNSSDLTDALMELLSAGSDKEDET